MKQYFGEYIRNLRTDKGYTLTQLGGKLDLDSANLSKIKNGKRLELLASVFGLDIVNLKTEFFGEIFAKKIYETNCSTEVLNVAEEKVKYYREQNVKQGKPKL